MLKIHKSPLFRMRTIFSQLDKAASGKYYCELRDSRGVKLIFADSQYCLHSSVSHPWEERMLYTHDSQKTFALHAPSSTVTEWKVRRQQTHWSKSFLSNDHLSHAFLKKQAQQKLMRHTKIHSLCCSPHSSNLTHKDLSLCCIIHQWVYKIKGITVQLYVHINRV